MLPPPVFLLEVRAQRATRETDGRLRRPGGGAFGALGAPSAPFSSAGGGARALKVSQDSQKSHTLVLAAAPEGQTSRTLVLQAAPVGHRDTELIVWGGGLGTKSLVP